MSGATNAKERRTLKTHPAEAMQNEDFHYVRATRSEGMFAVLRYWHAQVVKSLEGEKGAPKSGKLCDESNTMNERRDLIALSYMMRVEWDTFLAAKKSFQAKMELAQKNGRPFAAVSQCV